MYVFSYKAVDHRILRLLVEGYEGRVEIVINRHGGEIHQQDDWQKDCEASLQFEPFEFLALLASLSQERRQENVSIRSIPLAIR